jgi:hypothetical protein
VPRFCRHNRLIQNCSICAREQEIELRPLVSSSAPRGIERGRVARGARQRSDRPARPDRAGVRVQRLSRGADDGYRCELVPGLKSSVEAGRLAEEVAFAARRLVVLEEDPPGLYAEVATPSVDLEERTWLAFLIAYLGPLDGPQPFAAIAQARVPWKAAPVAALPEVQTGPRAAHDPAVGKRTVESYVAWAARFGGQAAAFTGEHAWTPERRFERAYERLALPGFGRDARFDLLVTLGRLGLYELRAARLALGGANEVTVAAKRVLGIGDPLLLERRAAALADAAAVPLEALDLAFYNWNPPAGRAERATGGLGVDGEPDPDTLAAMRAALGL